MIRPDEGILVPAAPVYDFDQHQLISGNFLYYDGVPAPVARDRPTILATYGG